MSKIVVDLPNFIISNFVVQQNEANSSIFFFLHTVHNSIECIYFNVRVF